MTVNYTTNLSLGQPVTGTESGTWGDDVNNAVTSYLDIAISGSLALTSASFTANALTLTNTQGTSSATNIGATTAQYYVLRISSLVANVTITAPSTSSSPSIASKTYLVVNDDATYSVTVKASGQTGTSIGPGERATVYYNGTDYIKVTSSVASNLTGTLPVANGGTGVTTSTGTGNTVLSASPTFTGTPTLPTGSIGVTQSSGNNTTALATTAFVQTALQLIYPIGSIYTNASSSTNPGTLFGFGTWTAFGAGRVPIGNGVTTTVTSGSFVIGYKYTIVSLGTTNFTLIGASSNTVGVVFTATGIGAGTGTASKTWVATDTGGSTDAVVISHNHSVTAISTSTVNLDHTHSYNDTGSFAGGSGAGAAVVQGNPNNRSTSTMSANATHSHTLTGNTDTSGVDGTYLNMQPYIVVYMWQRTA